MKVKQTEQASDIILKDQLFQAFKSDNPPSQETDFFLSLADCWKEPHLTM